jgi:hypothetical protein
MAGIKESTRVKLLLLHGFALLTLGMLLFYVRGTMEFFHAFGCALGMLLIASSLILLAVLDWICIVGQGPEQASKLRGSCRGRRFGFVSGSDNPDVLLPDRCLHAPARLRKISTLQKPYRHRQGPDDIDRACRHCISLWGRVDFSRRLGRTDGYYSVGVLFAVHGRADDPLHVLFA